MQMAILEDTTALQQSNARTSSVRLGDFQTGEFYFLVTLCCTTVGYRHRGSLRTVQSFPHMTKKLRADLVSHRVFGVTGCTYYALSSIIVVYLPTLFERTQLNCPSLEVATE